VKAYSISNGPVEVNAIEYGCIITSLRVPDRNGRADDVVLGHSRLEPYLINEPYLGALVGRYANRIAAGRFRLEAIEYRLETNDGPNHLHGGRRGFDKRLWSSTEVVGPDYAGVQFMRTSPAGEEGYPGELCVAVTYVLAADATLLTHIEATTDAPTIVNLTQHSYFNLGGETSASVLDHDLKIFADCYTPVDDTLIPIGPLATVAGTPFDFRAVTRVSDRIGDGHAQLRRAGGFDHNFVLGPRGTEPAVAAELIHAASGRRLAIATTEPGLQFYSGHLLDGRIEDAYGRPLVPFAGLCLETQHFPDTPNHPEFPSVTLRPGELYNSTTAWRFSTL
jgi:aldose 1-epimerase